MSNIQTAKQQDSIPALHMAEQELINVLRNSLYPGAQDTSIQMVIGYCKASGLDPMLKPVHIVPMKVSSGKVDQHGNDIKEMRDVIMPGVGLYRTNAARTGQYAGVSEPEFGPTQHFNYQKEHWVTNGNGKRVKTQVEATVAYPEWCKVTVEKLLDGQVRQFTAKEYWLENFAEKYDGSPNAMWAKRPFGQLAKCAEAQALRKAFPEVGAAPTADEMEGKGLDEQPRDVTPKAETVQTATAATTSQAEQVTKTADTRPPYPEAEFDTQKPAWQSLIDKGRKPAAIIAKIQTKYTLSDAQIEAIHNLEAIDHTPESEQVEQAA